MRGRLTHYRHRLTFTSEILSGTGHVMQSEEVVCGSRREYDRRVTEEGRFLRSLDLAVESVAVPVSEDKESMGQYLLRMGELAREKCSWREPDGLCNFFEDGGKHPQCDHDPVDRPCPGFHNETISG